MWKQREKNNWHREQMPRNAGEKEVTKTEIATEDCIKRDIERAGEEWRKEQHI